MDDIILRSLSGTATRSEEAALREWRLASPENQQRYRDLARVWALTAAGNTTARGSGAVPTTESIIQLASSRHRASVRPAALARKRVLVASLAAAAAIVLAVGAWRLVTLLGSGSGFGAAEFVNKNAEMVTASLSDGTIVRLAPRSRLRLVGRHGRREVWLEGRAFFAVAKRNGEPLIVHSAAGDARVFGTRFELVSTSDSLHLLVVEGRVALSAAGKVLDVDAGHEASATARMAPVLDSIRDPELQLKWLPRFLVFRDSPLTSVVKEIQHQYGARVRLADSTLATRTVTAWFDDEPLDRVLEVVCRVTDTQCAHQADGSIAIEVRTVGGAAPVGAKAFGHR